MIEKISLSEKFLLFQGRWAPKIVAELCVIPRGGRAQTGGGQRGSGPSFRTSLDTQHR